MDSRPFLFFLPVVWSQALQQDSPVLLNITSGADVVLPCPCPPEWLVLLWTRPDLEDRCVWYKWDLKEVDLNSYLHPSYRGRVQPGVGCDVVLTNTSTNDSGEYECRVRFNTTGSSAWNESCHVVQLRVQDPPVGDNREPRVEEDPPRRRDGVITSMILFPLLILMLLITCLWCQRKKEIRQKYRSFLEVLTSTCRLKSPDSPNLPSPETNVLHCPGIV